MGWRRLFWWILRDDYEPEPSKKQRVNGADRVRNSELYHLIHDALSFYKQYWEENNHEKIVTINF